MGNQQATSINENYIAGLIDSDFGVYITKNTYKGKLQFSPIVRLKNTRFSIVDACSDFLLSVGINHHVKIFEPTINKPYKQLQIQRLTKCLMFADMFKGLCVGRRKQLELIKDFCESRLRVLNTNSFANRNTPYSDEQREIFGRLYLLNLDYGKLNGYRNITPSWLAGMIDGDGSIFMVLTHRESRYTNKEGKETVYKYPKIFPYVKVTTESYDVRDNVVDIYKKLGVRYYVETVRGKASRKLGKNKKKYYYSIVVKEFDSVLSVLNYIDKHLIGKQKQLELMRYYINLKKRDRSNTQECFEIVEKMKELNK